MKIEATACNMCGRVIENRAQADGWIHFTKPVTVEVTYRGEISGPRHRVDDFCSVLCFSNWGKLSPDTIINTNTHHKHELSTHFKQLIEECGKKLSSL